MKIDYTTNEIGVYLFRDDLIKVVESGMIRKSVVGKNSGVRRMFDVYGVDDRFFSMGGVAENMIADRDSFDGWCLDSPNRLEATEFSDTVDGKPSRDYSTVGIRMSRPVIQDVLDSGGGYFCGMARGSSVGHVIDRINLYLYPKIKFTDSLLL